MRSLVLFEYAIFKCYNTAESQLPLSFPENRSGGEGFKVGSSARSPRPLLAAQDSQQGGRWQYLKTIQKGADVCVLEAQARNADVVSHTGG
jgi:hypothetical protein